MMKVLLILIPSILCIKALGQDFHPSTHPGNFSADQSTISGHVSTLPYETERVEKALLKYLRTYGRTEKMRGYFLTTDIQNLTSEDFEILVFSKVEAVGLLSKVWMGMDTAGLGTADHERISEQLGELLLNFSRIVHVEHLQNRITEAEREAILKSRGYQKLVNEQSTLERKVSLNEAERIRFTEALERNAQEKVVLRERQDLNRKLQNLASQELDQMNQNVDQLRIQLNEFQGTF